MTNVTLRLVLVFVSMMGNFADCPLPDTLCLVLLNLLKICIVTSVGTTGDILQPMMTIFCAILIYVLNVIIHILKNLKNLILEKYSLSIVVDGGHKSILFELSS